MRLRLLVAIAVLFLTTTALLAWATPRAGASALTGRGMWIWHLDRSDGGNVAAIAARARAAGVKTVLVKSSDGGSYWSQFSPQLVSALHAAGLNVCAWQYVYGSLPLSEAALGARAVRVGADCLVIDAEAEYEGRYASAQTYMRALRSAVGTGYPLGLSSFPYVDFHPSFPYSVFLGPGGAQFNLPQMYWKDIGSSIDGVFAHTVTYNKIYGRRILPVGQTYGSPTASEFERFRSLTVAYGAHGISWWDWAWTSADAAWAPIHALLATPSGFAGPARGEPLLAIGAKGDDVLWMQEHLARAIPGQRITGLFGAQTRSDLRAFQARRGLSATGVTDNATWHALLAVRPVAVSWAANSRTARVAPRGPGHLTGGTAAPESAGLPAVAYEIPELGADHPIRSGGVAASQ
jgi:peptidoglycan hydrolase-like protein with peptidoglycan-binding domain